jgi:hypothetical protein
MDADLSHHVSIIIYNSYSYIAKIHSSIYWENGAN